MHRINKMGNVLKLSETIAHGWARRYISIANVSLKHCATFSRPKNYDLCMGYWNVNSRVRVALSAKTQNA